MLPLATISGSCHHWEFSVIIFKSIEDPQDKRKLNLELSDKKKTIEFPICLYV